MYRITNVTDRCGVVKQEFIDKMKEKHPNLKGKILNKANLKGNIFLDCMRFEWADDSGLMLRTSLVTEFKEDGDVITITTLNSIYTLEREVNK